MGVARWWSSWVKQGRWPIGIGEPTSLGRSGPWRWSSQASSARVVGLVALTGWWLTWSMSTARQRVWLETRWVPLTSREWPECRQEIRSVQWAARTVSSDWMRRSSRGLPRSWAGLQPWRVVGCRWGLWASAWVKGSAGWGGGAVWGGARARTWWAYQQAWL